MTCPPDAFNSQVDLVVLEPGAETAHPGGSRRSEIEVSLIREPFPSTANDEGTG